MYLITFPIYNQRFDFTSLRYPTKKDLLKLSFSLIINNEDLKDIIKIEILDYKSSTCRRVSIRYMDTSVEYLIKIVKISRIEKSEKVNINKLLTHPSGVIRNFVRNFTKDL